MNVIGLKELIGNTMIIFLITMTVMYFIGQISTRIKNKTKTKQNQQIIRTGLKILKSVY